MLLRKTFLFIIIFKCRYIDISKSLWCDPLIMIFSSSLNYFSPRNRFIEQTSQIYHLNRQEINELIFTLRNDPSSTESRDMVIILIAISNGRRRGQ
jgi:hypothetical protein